MTSSIITFSIKTLGRIHYTDIYDIILIGIPNATVMFHVIMLSVNMLSVVMLGVITMSVVAPFDRQQVYKKIFKMSDMVP